jgi:DUF4097 and DUF4098 domain-containing protein YvlB
MKLSIAIFGISSILLAQDASRISVPLSDPSRPGTVKVSLMNSCFAIEGYDGKEITIESAGRGGDRTVPKPPRGAEGMKRIEPSGNGLSVEEDNNMVRIHSSAGTTGELLIRVPYSTSLKLECMNGGEIKVNRVAGDIELQNLNGAVTATNVSGSIVAHSLNGRVLVTMDKITPGKPMSFTSMNGDVDVTLPPDTKGTLRMKTDHGEIYSDFDVKVGASSGPVVEDGRAKGGKYRIKVDQTTVGTINGGGPDFKLQTFNGNIFIRNKPGAAQR